MTTVGKVFIGGTDGGFDGNPVSDGTGSVPISLLNAGLNVKVKVHYRCWDDITHDDNSEDSTLVAAPTLPEGVEACFTENGTYSRTPTADAGKWQGANKPLWLRQIAGAVGSLQFVAPSFVAGTRLAAPTGLTATAGFEQVALAWTAVSGATGHQARYRTAAVGETPAGAWSTRVATTSSTGHTFTGLTAGTTYDFEVTASDANGRGAAAAAAAAAAVELTFTDAFSDSSLHPRWAAFIVAPGTYAETTSLNISTTDAGRVILAHKTAVPTDAATTFITRGTRDNTGNLLVVAGLCAGLPTDALTGSPRIFIAQHNTGLTYFYYIPAAGGDAVSFAEGSNAWTTEGFNAYTGVASTAYRWRLTCTASGVKCGVYSSDGTLLKESTVVPWSTFMPSGTTPYFYVGDHLATFYSGGLTITEIVRS